MLERRRTSVQFVVLGWVFLAGFIVRNFLRPDLFFQIKETPEYYQVLLHNYSTEYSVEDLPVDDHSTLLNISNFKYIINNNVCKVLSPPLVLAFVHSAPKNYEYRKFIRDTWGQEVTIVFLLGLTSDTLQREIETENSIHHDIVQGNFIDSYRNLTYKHVMGHKWAFYHCSGAKYLLKTDDDVFINVFFLRKFIESKLSYLGARRLILCEIQMTVVQRSYRSKWRVSPKEYDKSWYPHICAGWAILYSPDVSFHLYKAAKYTPYFWIDDVYMTGILAPKFNLSLTSVHPYAIHKEEVENLLKKPYLEPEDDFLFCYPRSLLIEMNNLWRILKNTTRYFENFTHTEVYG